MWPQFLSRPHANHLGALYYMGDVVGQDYGQAKELYEAAEARGVVQAMIMGNEDL